MLQVRWWVNATIIAVSLSGCSKSEDKAPDTGLGATSAVGCDSASLTDKDGAWMDPSMSNEECSGIRSLYSAVRSAQLTATPNSEFERIFGKRDSSGVTNYLNQRVHYIVPNATNFRISAKDQSEELPNTGEMTVATNMGVAFWKARQMMIKQYPDLSFSIGRTPIEANSPAVGFIQLGKNFAKYSLMQRMNTVVHEARHSDCEAESSELCGLMHTKCPTGHDYEDLAACDSRGIGPYYVGAIYSKVLGDTCANCSEEERQTALLTAADSLNRVMNLSQIKSGREKSYNIPTLPGFSPAGQRETLRKVVESRKRELGK